MAGLNLSRSANLYVSTIKDEEDYSLGTPVARDDTNTFEIYVLDGFSFSQDANTQEITLDEAGCAPVRGQKIYNTALNPAEFSFETYVRPYEYTNVTDFHACVEHVLWNALISDTLVTVGEAETTGEPLDSSDGNKLVIDFTESDKHSLLDLYLFFKLDTVAYRLNAAKITSAEIDFSIDAITKITWTGQAETIDVLDDASGFPAVSAWVSGTDYAPVPAVTSYIKNKLSSVSIEDTLAPNLGDTYIIPITGGSLTIENNITFLTPDELATVNFPIGSFTGTRAITGNLTAYLRSSAGSDTESGDLLKNLIEDRATVTQEFDVIINIGSCNAAADVGPFIKLTMSQCHLTIPSINVEDVVSTEIGFTALGTDLDQQDELVVWYVNSGDGVT